MIFAAQQAFYEAAAQIIPILLLVMAVGEYRLGRRINPAKAHEVYPAVIFVTVVMLVGELAALRVLLRGSDSAALEALTNASLASGFAFLVISMARELLLPSGASLTHDVSVRRMRLLGLTGLGIAFAAYFMLAA